jgi:hypothetical protein
MLSRSGSPAQNAGMGWPVGGFFLGLDFFGYFFGQCKKVTNAGDGHIKKY